MRRQDTFLTGTDCGKLSIKKLPSGFGSVRYLGKGRFNPYAVHPPDTKRKLAQPGKELSRRPPALCYVRNRETGIKALVIYHAGLYVSGLENDPVILNQLYKTIMDKVYGSELKEDMSLSLKALSQLKMCLDELADSGALPAALSYTSADAFSGALSDASADAFSGALSDASADAFSGALYGVLSDAFSGSLSLQYEESMPEGRNTPRKSEILSLWNPGKITTNDAGKPQTDSENIPDDSGRMPPGSGIPPADIATPPADTGRTLASADIQSADTGRLPANLGRPQADTEPDLRNEGIPGAGEISLPMSLRTGQPGSAGELYARLYYLQTYIKSLMEDIDWIKSDQSNNGDHHIISRYNTHAISKLDISEDRFKFVSGTSVESALPGADSLALLSAASVPTFSGANAPTFIGVNTPTLSTVYAAFHQFKYGPQAAKQLSKSSRNVTAAAYRKLACFYDRSLDEISVMEWQELVNKTAASGRSRSAVTDLVTLIRQLYRFAFPREMCTREYGNYIVMPYTSEESHHQDFTDAELKILWEHQDDPVAGMILIMCYSGFRIGEYETLQVFLDQNGKTGYFRGGIKTKAGKNRIVPIHSAIMPLVSLILDKNGQPVFFCGKSSSRFREMMKQTLVRLGIDTLPDNKHGEIKPGKSDTLPIGTVTQKSGSSPGKPDNLPGRTSPGKSGSSPGSLPVSGIYRKPHGEYRYHTPHSSRHTFSRLCESYGVNEADRRRMLGHSFGNDITNGVYGHRSVEELRAELEKIKIPSE